VVARGRGRSNKDSEQAAAKAALEVMDAPKESAAAKDALP
jgi:dsRNA-specific ribonuclease